MYLGRLVAVSSDTKKRLLRAARSRKYTELTMRTKPARGDRGPESTTSCLNLYGLGIKLGIETELIAITFNKIPAITTPTDPRISSPRGTVGSGEGTPWCSVCTRTAAPTRPSPRPGSSWQSSWRYPLDSWDTWPSRRGVWRPPASEWSKAHTLGGRYYTVDINYHYSPWKLNLQTLTRDAL